ncbi:MAG: hypothetical protein MI674_06180 [Cytophagales bacterium]|nr:hypothetical protein [Cytophagales bacterium]
MRKIYNFPKIFLLRSSKRFLLQLTLLLVLLLSSYASKGQESKPVRERLPMYPFTIQINPHLYYFSLNPHLARGGRGMSIDIGWLYASRQIGEAYNFYPQIGFSFSYYKFRKRDNTDASIKKRDGLGGMAYVVPYYVNSRRHTVAPRLGAGVTRLHVPLDTLNSVQRAYEGLNLHLLFGLIYNVKITPKWNFTLGLNYNYLPSFSKNSEKKEDSNFSFVSMNIGAGYTPNPSNIAYTRRPRPKQNRVDVGFLSALKGIDQDQKEKRYYVGGVYGSYSMQVGGNSALTFTNEWIRDLAAEEKLKKARKSNKNDLKIGLLVGHEFLWGNLIFGQQLGVYVFNPCIPDEFPLYLRLGLNYRVTKAFFLGINVKHCLENDQGSSSVKVDFVDFRVGYSLN